MQPSTSLSSTLLSTVGMLLSLALVNALDTVDMPSLELSNSFSSETIKYLSEVDGKVVSISKIKSALIALKEASVIDSFNVQTEDTSDITTFLINIPKSKDIQKLVNTNIAIADIFNGISENYIEQFTTIQRMV